MGGRKNGTRTLLVLFLIGGRGRFAAIPLVVVHRCCGGFGLRSALGMLIGSGGFLIGVFFLGLEANGARRQAGDRRSWRTG